MATQLADVYEIPEELRDFRDTIRQIVREQVWPRAAEIDRSGEYPWDLRRLFGEHDILALPMDEQYGGTGTRTLLLQIAVGEVAKASASAALILMVHERGWLPIQQSGSEEAREGLLPAFAPGGGCPPFCLTGPQ